MPGNIVAVHRKNEDSGSTSDARASVQAGNKPGNGVVTPTPAPTMRITSILYYMCGSRL